MFLHFSNDIVNSLFIDGGIFAAFNVARNAIQFIDFEQKFDIVAFSFLFHIGKSL
jgi:hypothetical protein